MHDQRTTSFRARQRQRRKARLSVEGCETRCLLSGYSVRLNSPYEAGTSIAGNVMEYADIANFQATDPSGKPVTSPAGFTATINWGDGTSSPGSITDYPGVQGLFEINSSHAYPNPSNGEYNVQVALTDPAGGEWYGRPSIATVDPRPDELNVSPVGNDMFSVTAGQLLQGKVATIQLNDPNATVTGLTAVIDNGPGTPQRSVIPARVGSGQVWQVFDPFRYSTPGTFPLNIQIQDNQADAPPRLQGKITVTAPPPSPPANPQPPPPTIPPQGNVITADQIRQIYPPPPGPKPPKPLPKEASPTQKARYQHDLGQYQLKNEAYVRKLAPYNARVQALADLLNNAELRSRFGLDSPQRRAAFLGQMGAETANLQIVDEKPSVYSGPNFARYENRPDLGNTQPGDGAKFHGRGDLQITGRTGYQLAANALGIDLINNPALAATDPNIAALVSAWYWGWKTAYVYDPATGRLSKTDPITRQSLITGMTKNGPIYQKFTLSQLADRGDIYSIAHNINAATLAIHQRLADTARAWSILVPKK